MNSQANHAQARQIFLETSRLSDLRPFPIKRIPIKRIFDIGFSLCALLSLLPVFALLALLVKLTSKGTIFFGQERIGRGGKPFKCYKFRTMFQDAEARLETILKENPALKEEWTSSFKLKSDPRITKVGKWLRRTSLDELPQFWNVLKGDLSIVGPRPVVREEIEGFYGSKAYKILSIRPGITGLWQVSGRNDISYAARIRLDEEYVNTHSLQLDLLLIAKTIPCLLRSRGAY